MVQFNLLPDVKVQYIKTLKIKRLTIAVSIIAVAVSAGILVLFMSYAAVQKRHLSNLDSDISAMRAELEDNESLGKILSVQNQLRSLPELYNGRPAAERLTEFIDQTTPVGVGLGRLIIDFSLNTMELSGSAKSLELVNAHVDTLKLTAFKPEEDAELIPAFSNVVLAQFGRDKDEASFKISLEFDPQIFDANRKITLVVPTTVATRNQAESADLFDGSSPGDNHAE